MPDAPMLDGQLTFFQYFLPTLDAGRYTLTVSQEVQFDRPTPVHEEFINSTVFAVTSERFRIDGDLIDSAFPPRGSQGEYFNTLPHIVLTRPTYPWERQPTASAMMSASDVAPWLALLVFDAADPAPPLVTTTVASLRGALPAGTIAYDLRNLDFGESADEPCQTIDIPIDLFSRIAPSLDELTWLAHGRRVVTAKKAGSQPRDAAATRDFACIIGNRLPAMGRKTTVHLVSLDGLADILPGADATKRQAALRGVKAVRLISLTNWSFDTLAQSRSFSAVLEALDMSPGALRLGGGATPARGQAAERVRNALAMGFTALDHRLREGDQTVSWYRGPLVPYAARGEAISLPIASADAALRYDPGTGFLNTTYAAAWQLGRMLVLQSRDVANALFRWQRQTARQAVDAAEQRLLHERLGTSALALAESPGGSTLEQAIAATLRAMPQSPVWLGFTDPAPPAVELPALPDPLARWLEGLQLLRGVPFNYLVPDERMLPAESIRFFHLDGNWIASLIDGAYSIGRATSGDLSSEAASQAASTIVADAGPVTGFLMRSQAVTHWPGLEVQAYGRDGQTRLPILRFEALAADVLLCLFDGIVGKVDIHEPPEGLHFGLDMPDRGKIDRGTMFKRLRNPQDGSRLGPSNLAAGYRDVAAGVLDIAGLARAMQAGLGAPFTSAEFALEMIEGVGLVSFVNRQ